ncbi:MAG: hypothetical protein JSR44_13900 [Spirochaetes bacterium]|nr:hypothetical protein [Spirochaetota bacterium]
MRMQVVVLAALAMGACSKTHGKFAFTVADHTELTAFEKKVFQPQRFERPSTPPIFERDDVVWYAYQPLKLRSGAYYGISLQKKSLGYQEIDLRNRAIAEGQGLLIDNYQKLDEGEYRLKIAFENEVIDQIDFVVVGDSDSESIDFESDEKEDI